MYKRDYKLKEASEYIDTLDASYQSELIKYYIKHKENSITKLTLELNEYRDLFEKFERLLPKSYDQILRH
jgi:hypothetical protein